MKVKDFIKVYKEDTVIQSIAERIRPNETTRLRLKGLVGSLDAVVAAATYQINKQTNIFVLHDKEEAAYFHNDLQNLMGEKEVLLFPTSYKRPYQFDETENANILMRAEILNRINHKASIGELIVTYPEALTEKVINKKSLSSNTFTAKVGEALDVEFLTELLQTYDFEPTDFVYEAGQFSVRGGILDVFSYAHDLPYRIELFGNEIDSIRTFDPVSQLSKENIKEINIIPNVQTKLLAETRQSFLSFIPKNSKIWFKDYQQTLDTIEKYFIKATENFDQILGVTDAQIVLSPEELFEKHNTFKADLKGYTQLEFGSRAYLKADYTFDFEVEAQQSFNKDFDSIVENLGQWQLRNTSLCIASESLNQISRLETIFLELDPSLKVLPINISLREGFIDKNREVLCYTDHQLFDRFHKYKSKSKHSKSKALTLKELRSLHPGDYVAHIDHGIGRFVGLVKNEVNGKLQESIRLVYRDDDLLYVSVHSLHKISKYTGKEGVQPPISKLGSQEWENKKTRVKGKVKDIAKDLITLYSKRKSAPGFAFSEDGFMQAELESSFIYEDTPDQATATEHVKNDMELSHPMDRLICGDVGFGKTEIAIRAAFKAAVNGKQVAVLVPTTILAMQHFRTFSERLEKFPIKVEYINRFRTPKQIKETLARVKEGKTEILIGTHRIVNKDVQFKDLGLLVIDEEQKFGVKVKDKLKEFRVNVDVLTLTATPIPRTLHFSLMGARDLSVIATPPPNRQPVTTEIHGFNEVIMRDAISFELRRGGQVFVVHNRINDIEQIGNIILKLVPDARIGIAHGQMEGSQLEKRMMKFIEGEYDVLVSTNIIESGLDIPNANTIIINHAHMFGLSDLHQMRGRVGRSNRKAFCYLLTPPSIGLSSESRKRLSALEEFSDLGDGFKVAMRDLDIRGAGNLLGAEQRGLISALGFEMYHKILDEAVQELKDNEFKDLFVKDLTKEAAKVVERDCTIETDMEILIPDKYVSNISERIGLYAKLDSIKNEEKLQEFITNVSDRFGAMPEAVKDLVETVRLRWQAEQLGFEKVVMKNEVMKCYFMPSENEAYFQSPIFGKIIAFVQQRPRKSKMKEHRTRLILTFNEVNSVDEGKALFKEMLQE